MISRQHRARIARRDWGTRIGITPGPTEPFLDPNEAARIETLLNARKDS